MDMPAALVSRFPPSNQHLLDATRWQIDDEMLWEIAIADYGHDADAHLTALRSIWAQGVVALPLDWYPGEVLALTSWSDPDNSQTSTQCGCDGPARPSDSRLCLRRSSQNRR